MLASSPSRKISLEFGEFFTPMIKDQYRLGKQHQRDQLQALASSLAHTPNQRCFRMLTVTSLSYAFAERQLFADVSFRLRPGDILHLQGANGVGKSTLLSMIAGLRSPTSGQIECTPLGAEPLRDRRQFFSYLAAEANGLYLKMDAKDNLMFWSELRGHALPAEEADKLLKRWGLGHRLLRQGFPVGRFSTGMRRRLALARVSLSGAPCWLLDEPIYGLDDKGIALLQELLAAHQAAGGMAIIVSHAEAGLSPVINLTYELT